MFDIRELPVDSYGEVDHERVHEYINGLIVEFSDSPEAQPLIKRGKYLQYVGMMLDYAFNHVGVGPIDMTVYDSDEVIFRLFPRKVSTEAENAPAIIKELIAFWAFLKRQYQLANADVILTTLNDDAVLRLRQELSDPSNFGMAKSFVMKGMAAGFDMTTEDGAAAWAIQYNRLLAQPPQPPGDPVGIGFHGRTPRERHEERRKERKRQRQAQKRNRR